MNFTISSDPYAIYSKEEGSFESEAELSQRLGPRELRIQVMWCSCRLGFERRKIRCGKGYWGLLPAPLLAYLMHDGLKHTTPMPLPETDFFQDDHRMQFLRNVTITQLGKGDCEMLPLQIRIYMHV